MSTAVGVVRPLTPRPRALGAGAGALAPDRGWDPLLVALAAYVLTSVGRIHQLVGFLAPVHLALVSAIVAIAIYTTSGGAARRLRLVSRHPVTLGVLGLAGWMMVTIPFALWRGWAFDEWWGRFLKAAVMYVVLAGAVRGLRDVERLAFTYLIAVGIYSAVVVTRLHITGPDWRLAVLYDYDANEYAALIAMSLPLVAYFTLQRGPVWRRAAALGAGMLLAVGFVWAGSRGGFLALVVVGAFLLLRYRGVRLGWRVAAAGVLATALVTTATDSFWHKMTTIISPGSDYNVTGEQGRMKIWARGVGYMLHHPVFGVGAGNFPVAEGTISPLVRSARPNQGVKWSVSHNSFIQVGAELGFPGLALFLVMLVSAWTALGAIGRRPGPPSRPGGGPPGTHLAQALAGSLVAFAVGGFFLSLAYRDFLFVLLALIVGLDKVIRRAPPRHGRAEIRP